MLNADLFRDRRSQLAKVVLLMCGCYFALAFAGQAWKAQGLDEALDAERAKLSQQEAINRRLQARLNFLNGPGYDAYAERVAREKLGLAKEGDVTLFVVPDVEAPSRRPQPPLPGKARTPAPQPAPSPVWRQWAEVFFPRK